MDEAAIEEHIDGIRNELPPPDLDYSWAEYLFAFHELSPSRNVGMGLGAIPMTEIRAYRKEFGFDDRELFFRMVRALDGAWLKWADEKRQKK